MKSVKETTGIKIVRRIICGGIVFLAANYLFFPGVSGKGRWFYLFFIMVYLMLNIVPSAANRKLPKRQHRVCADGCELLIYFLISVTASVFWLLIKVPDIFSGAGGRWLGNLLCVILAEAVVFWNGILRIYLTSAQIGIKWRVIGILCGWIPIVNLAVLMKLIRISMDESQLESEKIIKAQEAGAEELCQTKYPILMVHGVFFRDFKYFNYWGRIPGELEARGAKIYYGNHQSAASVADSGAELSERIHEIIRETGCKKVNIIAHSKGGLDCRYAISELGMAPYVASLTTVNTPHRGCVFADYLLNKIPAGAKEKVAETYNAALKKAGMKTRIFLRRLQTLLHPHVRISTLM